MKNIAYIALAALVAVPICFAQGKIAVDEKPKPKRQRGPKPRLVPFHLVSKSAGFTVLMADKNQFNEMESEVFTISKDFIPELSKPVELVQLTYGYKKGGISAIYMTPKVGKLTAEQVIKPLVDKKLVKDRQYFKGWSITSVKNSKLLIMVSGTTPEVRDAMIKSMK